MLKTALVTMLLMISAMTYAQPQAPPQPPANGIALDELDRTKLELVHQKLANFLMASQQIQNQMAELRNQYNSGIPALRKKYNVPDGVIEENFFMIVPSDNPAPVATTSPAAAKPLAGPAATQPPSATPAPTAADKPKPQAPPKKKP